MHRKFPSLAFGNEYGYAFDSQAFDMKAPVDDHFRMFKTYGDGTVQHSGDWSVTLDYFADYLASLAAVMVEDVELLTAVRFQFADRPNRDAIVFAASVRWKEGDNKTRYFSPKELKVSSSPSKYHDKRYEEVRDFHDGSAKSMYRILIPEYARGLLAYSYATAIRDWLLEDQNGRPYMQLPGEFLQWSKERDDAMKLRDAYDSCWNLVQAYQFRCLAEGSLKNYKRTLVPPPAKATEAA